MTKNTRWASRDAMKQAAVTAIRECDKVLERLGRLQDAYEDREVIVNDQLSVLIPVALALKEGIEQLHQSL